MLGFRLAGNNARSNSVDEGKGHLRSTLSDDPELTLTADPLADEFHVTDQYALTFTGIERLCETDDGQNERPPEPDSLGSGAADSISTRIHHLATGR